MGGSAISDGWGIAPTETRTLVVIGRTGDGKSCTGNSILGRKAFRSIPSSAGSTSTCELQRTQLPNGPILDVIDTPGWFDFSIDPEIIGKELMNCIDLAKDGIHAFLLVLSVRSRFSREQQAAIQRFQHFLGNDISDYMIVVFTGGDDLEVHDVTLDAYLGVDCPEPLKETLAMCQNRLVQFDNRTKDPIKKAEQLKDLLFQVNLVGEKNGCKPYTYNLFKELKEGTMNYCNQKAKVDSSTGYSEEDIKELKDQMQRSHDEQIRRITEAVPCKLKDTRQKLEKQLKKEHAARLVAEQKVKKAQKKSKDENRKLKHLLERSRRETKEVRDRMLQISNVLEVNIWGMHMFWKFFR